ncbi:transporter substrate-binding domain-containing protein [Mammaliicoccus sciuri]|uniref:Polar amino acid transport system substrate-binding protein n=1 Tax=Sporosarcina newyorkensis TaxID=759851 RepID=A0A1T4Y6L4_9BACL|nr:transporter substrate-binding domain-containing protein [Sporosarcina newyorkensis]SKA97484.1 polar amino acid transport system substrate-binding protein [Sporosarcina newyorkensis]
MKKTVSALLLILVLIIAGCSNNDGGGAGTTEKSTLKNIQDKKKLVVGIAPGYFPFEMKSTEGGYVGYDIDLANAVGEWLKVDVEFKQFVFDGLVPALQTGEVDMVIAGMTIRGDRALAVGMSDPYYKTGQAIMVPAANKDVKSWEELDVKGKKIAVGVGTTGALLAKSQFKNAEVVDFEDFPLAATAMGSGQADAVVYDEPAIAVWRLEHEGQVHQVEGLLSAENLGIAVKKNDFETLQWLNSFLHGYIDSPEELESRTRWFEESDWLTKVTED